jgi:hypothetical protein
MQRAQGVRSKDRLYYQLGAKRFANLEPVLHEVSEIVLAYLLELRDGPAAFLFGSLNKATRVLLRDLVMAAPTPDLGDAKPWCDWPPVYKNLRERVGWVFVRCHLCDEHSATERMGFTLVDDTRVETAMVCQSCAAWSWARRGSFRFSHLRGGRLVLVGVGTLLSSNDADKAHSLALLKANLESVQVRVARVAEQRWRLPIAHARQARRSVPIESPTPRIPPLKIMYKAHRVVELLASIKLGGMPQTDFQLSVIKERAEEILAAREHRALFLLLMTKAFNLQARRMLLCAMAMTKAVQTAPQRDGRKPTASNVWRVPHLECSHGFRSNRSAARLMRCSLCAANDA